MSPDSSRSALSWIIIIAFGILLGNGLTVFAERLYIQYQEDGLPTSLQDLEDMLEPHSAASPADQARQQQEKKIQTQLDGNCAYWKDQAAQMDNAQNRAFRDTACARAKGMFR